VAKLFYYKDQYVCYEVRQKNKKKTKKKRYAVDLYSGISFPHNLTILII